MEIYRNEAGLLEVTGGKIELTDPGYKTSTNVINVLNGQYLCAAWTGRDKDFGTRVWMSEIVLNRCDVLKMANKEENWSDANYAVPVDAGLVGYFVNKPSFKTEKNWLDFCNWTYSKKGRAKKILDTRLVNDTDSFISEGEKSWSGFWTASGIGDGCYPVKVLKDGKDIVGIRVIFY